MDYTTFRATFFDEYRAHVAQDQSQDAMNACLKLFHSSNDNTTP